MGSHKKQRRSSTSSSSSSDAKYSRKRKKCHSKTKRKRLQKKKHLSSSDTTSSSSSETSSSSSSEEEKRKIKKKTKLAKQKKIEDTKTDEGSADIPLDLMTKSKAMAPMTKEEWEKQQSLVRRVYDESTGRYRLIKGDGEVLEEIVSRDRHKAINQQATKGDGNFFQSQLSKQLKK